MKDDTTTGETAAGETYTVVLAKADFKFSSSHFTIFSDRQAELLHGHNYQVEVELSGRSLGAEDLLVDFVSVKRAIRSACDRLDEQTLVPTQSPHLRVVEKGDDLEVVYGDRSYRLPAADVVLLPLVNISIEALARMLWRQLATEVELPRIDTLGVGVAETIGQGCWYRAPLR